MGGVLFFCFKIICRLVLYILLKKIKDVSREFDESRVKYSSLQAALLVSFVNWERFPFFFFFNILFAAVALLPSKFKRTNS